MCTDDVNDSTGLKLDVLTERKFVSESVSHWKIQKSNTQNHHTEMAKSQSLLPKHLYFREKERHRRVNSYSQYKKILLGSK